MTFPLIPVAPSPMPGQPTGPTLPPLAFTCLFQHLSALEDAELVSLSLEEARP